MTRRDLWSLLPLAVPVRAAAPRPVDGWNVRQHGAVGDGLKLETRALQSTIDACSAANGGTVLVPPGRYLTGSLTLRSGVHLYLDAGATLLGSPKLDDYTPFHPEIPTYTRNYTVRALIVAEKATELGISGPGQIDGNGTAFAGPYLVRPYLLRFASCKGVALRDLRLVNAAMWVQHYLDCEDLLLDGVRVFAHRLGVNNDGVDIDSCRRVRIANSDFDAGDDAIVLKATTSLPCRDVVITNCILKSSCNAFKLGTESNGGYDDIVLSNCTILDTKLSGIALEMVDGGTLSRVSVSNVVMRDVGCPIFVRLGNRARPIAENLPQPDVGALRGVRIRGLQATATSTVGCSITGIPGHAAEDVALEDISIQMPGGGVASDVAREIPEQVAAYPEFQMFKTLPAFGFYVRHARNIALRRVAVTTAAADARPMLVADDVDGLQLQEVSGSALGQSAALLDLRNSRHITIRGCRPSRTGQRLFHVTGEQRRGIDIR